MKTISIIIPFCDLDIDIERTANSIKNQQIDLDNLEILIVSSLKETENTSLSRFFSGIKCDFTIKNIEKASSEILLNTGIDDCHGEYILFLKAGDEIHPALLMNVASIIENSDADLISFHRTIAHRDFTRFGDDPFTIEDFSFIGIEDDMTRREYLCSDFFDECYLCHVYRKSLISSIGLYFSKTYCDIDYVFAYILLFFTKSIYYTFDHGYCSFEYKNTDREAIADTKNCRFEELKKRISDRLNLQTNLYQMLCGIPEIAGEYKDIIEAHFVKECYVQNMKLLRAFGDGIDKILLFDILKYIVLNIVPHWISNDIIYSFNRDELELLTLMNADISSDRELGDALTAKRKVTVITATYNRASYLKKSIECILGQTYQNFEYIIVDDGSTDNTQEVVNGFDDDRIKLISNKNNKGVSHARNIGLTNAKGDYIVFQDDDDFCRLDKIEKQLNYILGLPDNYKFTYCECILHEEYEALAKENKNNSVITTSSVIPKREMTDVRKNGYILPALLPKNFICSTAIFFKKECFEKAGVFNESLIAYEDWEITLRMSKLFDAAFLKEPLYDYYRRKNGLINNKDIEHRNKILEALIWIDKRYEQDRKKYGIESNIKVV